jgi:hypothetical protein
MSLPQSLRNLTPGLLLSVACLVSSGVRAAYVPEGGEFALLDDPRGDQIQPVVAVAPGGAWSYVGWEDNSTDTSGQGISARLLNSTLQGAYNRFRVNWTLSGNQERPAVAVLADRSVAFAYQSDHGGASRIYSLVFSPYVTLASGEVRVSSFTGGAQTEPSAAGLADGNLVVAWTSMSQEGVNNYSGVYARILSSEGDLLSGEFRVNDFLPGNQRSAAVAGLPDGRFVVTWVSETQRSTRSVDIFARLFYPNGVAASGEILVNTSTNRCEAPAIAVSAGGKFTIVWHETNLAAPGYGLDVFSRTFTGTTGSTVRQLNTRFTGNQRNPKIAANGENYLVAWNDSTDSGTPRGISGRFLGADGSPAGSVFQVNTTAIGRQASPAVAADGAGRFMVVWSAFVGGVGYDLYAQRFTSGTPIVAAPAAPFVTALDSTRLFVSWEAMPELNVSRYEIYADGAATPTASLTQNYWTHSGLAADSTHAYRLAYVLSDGHRSALSPATLQRTWATDGNSDLLPDDWQSAYWASASALAARANWDADGDGVNNRDEFLAGTDPTNPDSVFRTRLRRAGNAIELEWNAVPGLLYQVEHAGSLSAAAWQAVGQPVVATGSTATLNVPADGPGFYRITRVR